MFFSKLPQVLENSLNKRPFFYNIFIPFLLIISIFFTIFNIIRRKIFGYPKNNTNHLIISVGNIQLGGAGKSPVVYSLASEFCKNNKFTFILSRGYQSKHKENFFWSEQKDLALLNDENAELVFRLQAFREHFDIAQGPNKKGNLERIAKVRPQGVVLCDDAFHSFSLPRDIQILVWDYSLFCSAPYFALPVGPYREAFPVLPRKYFSSAQLNVWTRFSFSELASARNKLLGTLGKQGEKNLNRHVLAVSSLELWEMNDQGGYSVISWQELSRVHSLGVFLGIARPQRFLDEVASLMQDKVNYEYICLASDHRLPSESECLELRKSSAIITSLKDFSRVKIGGSFQRVFGSARVFVSAQTFQYFDLNLVPVSLHEALHVDSLVP